MTPLFHYKSNSNTKVFDAFFLLFIFIIPFFPVPKSRLGFIAPVVVFLLFAFMVILIIKKIKEFPFYTNIVIFILSFVILMLIDLINGIRFDNSLEFKYTLGRITALMVFLLVIFYLNQKGLKGINYLYMIMIASAIIVSIMIILEGFGFISTGLPSEGGRHLFGTRLPFRKATGVPISDGKLGTFLIPMFTLLLFPQLINTTLTNKLRWGFLTIIGFAIIIMQSRSGWLGLFVGLSFLLFYYIIKSKDISLYLLLLSFVFVVAYSTPLLGIVLSGFIGEGVQARTVSGRFLGAEQALDAIKTAFLIGHGHGAVFIENEVGKIHLIHNLYLDQLASAGFIGFLVLFSSHILFLSILIKKIFFSKIKEIVILSLWLITAWLSVFIESNLYRGFFNEYVSIYMALAVYIGFFYKKDAGI